MEATVCWFANVEYHRWSARGETEQELAADIERVVRERGAPERRWVEREKEGAA